ncbi:MAG: hypothetical protein WC495_05255 [Patescibacteria group bacterium]|jgi:hypothetical protein
MKNPLRNSLFLTALILVVTGVLLLIFGKTAEILTGLVCIVFGISMVSFSTLMRLKAEKNSTLEEKLGDREVKK